MMSKNNKLFIFVLFVFGLQVCLIIKQNADFAWWMHRLDKDHDLLEEFNNLFKTSGEQTLVNRSTLLRTIKFMIDESDELDPELVEFVRSLIVGPPNDGQPAPTLSDKKRTDFSQIGQSKYIDKLLDGKKDGFFVEAGGFDGESHSNTLFFELTRGWTGVLIEPIPSNYGKILTKRRKIFAINACLANRRPTVAKFRVQSVLSGRLTEMDEAQVQVMDRKDSKKIYAYVPCFSLVTILKALNVDRVDYFSLDVEGGELTVLQGLNFDQLDITTFSIEYGKRTEKRRLITNYLNSKGFNLTKDDTQDLYFMKN